MDSPLRIECMHRCLSLLFVALFSTVWLTPLTSHAEHDGKLQILLLGDSTAEGSIPRMLNKKGPHLEEVISSLLAAEGDLPPTNVINLGLSGEYIQRLVNSGRYDKEVPKLPGLDYILIRYGINDSARRENFTENFPKDFHDLLARLRKDHPAAVLIPMTVIPFSDEKGSTRINDLVRQVTAEEKLTLFDIYPRYAAELKKGPDMLNYRRFSLAKIPAKYHAFVKPFVVAEKDPKVVVMDNQLDAHFGHLPGWFGDRHPNLAGYNVIGDETAKFLAPIIRAKLGIKQPVATAATTPAAK
jgi:lysophospholipase L1-like esterase